MTIERADDKPKAPAFPSTPPHPDAPWITTWISAGNDIHSGTTTAPRLLEGTIIYN